MTFLLIRNPGSRSGKGRNLWPRITSLLTNAGAEFDVATTESAAHATQLARDCDADTVVAVGGDGTISRVLDGVMQSGRHDLRMGVIYTGTSPDFCRFHNIPTDTAAAVDMLLNDHVKHIDIGRVCFNGATTHFGCGVNVGLGPGVARGANRLRRYLGDGLGTGLSVAAAICRMCPLDVGLNIDGIHQVVRRCNNLSIVLNPHIASGLKLNVDLQCDDGRMAVVAVHGLGRCGFLGVVPAFYSGRIVERSGIFLQMCKRIEVSTHQPAELEFDGDPRGYLPASIEVIHKGLALIS